MPQLISNDIASKRAAGCISGPFTIEEAQIIFASHFHTSPLGLVENDLGSRKWWMICHLSKQDDCGESTNDWLDSDDFPMKYYPASQTADYVSLILLPGFAYNVGKFLSAWITLQCRRFLLLGFPCEHGRFLFHWISLPMHAGCSRTSDFPA